MSKDFGTYAHLSLFFHWEFCLRKILTSLLSQRSFQDLLRKKEGDRAMWEYPFAVAGVNITFMLIQMLDLEAGSFLNVSTQNRQHLPSSLRITTCPLFSF